MSYLVSISVDILNMLTCRLTGKQVYILSNACKALNKKLNSFEYSKRRALNYYGLRGHNLAIACKYLDIQSALTQDDEEFDIELEFLLLTNTKGNTRIAYVMLESGLIRFNCVERSHVRFTSRVNVVNHISSITTKRGYWKKVRDLLIVIAEGMPRGL